MKKIETIIKKCAECSWRRYDDSQRHCCGYKNSRRVLDSLDGIPTWCELEDVAVPVEDIVEPGC